MKTYSQKFPNVTIDPMWNTNPTDRLTTTLADGFTASRYASPPMGTWGLDPSRKESFEWDLAGLAEAKSRSRADTGRAAA
jgi:hypothetical protein